MASGPAVRARHMQIFVKHVDELPPSDRRAVEAAVEPGSRRTIDEASSIGWLPLAINVEYTRAAYRQIGPLRAKRFFKRMLLAELETPIFGSFVQRVIALAGTDPGTALRWVPKGIDVMYRDVGRWEHRSLGPRSASLDGYDVPAMVLEDDTWAAAVGHGLDATFDLTTRSGELRLEVCDPKQRRISFTASWR